MNSGTKIALFAFGGVASWIGVALGVSAAAGDAVEFPEALLLVGGVLAIGIGFFAMGRKPAGRAGAVAPPRPSAPRYTEPLADEGSSYDSLAGEGIRMDRPLGEQTGFFRGTTYVHEEPAPGAAKARRPRAALDSDDSAPPIVLE